MESQVGRVLRDGAGAEQAQPNCTPALHLSVAVLQSYPIHPARASIRLSLCHLTP